MSGSHTRRRPHRAAPWRLVPEQPRCTPQAWAAIVLLSLLALLAALGPFLTWV